MQVPDPDGLVSFAYQGLADSIPLFLTASSSGTKPTVNNVTASDVSGTDFDTSVVGNNGVPAKEDTEYQFTVDASGAQLSTKTVEVIANNVDQIFVTRSPTPEWVRVV